MALGWEHKAAFIASLALAGFNAETLDQSLALRRGMASTWERMDGQERAALVSAADEYDAANRQLLAEEDA